MKILHIVLSLFLIASTALAGTYRNPILHSDYSDPDVIRVGNDYWMTSSSFNCVPGLQILHSTDLVNWEIVGAALRQGPSVCWSDKYSGIQQSSPVQQVNPAQQSCPVQHGNGVWAPCIRFHEGIFYIFWGDPDYGIFQVHTEDPRGEWSEPVCVLAGKGLIDTSPLWDDDGRVYLVHGWAGSRNGFKSMLSVFEMDSNCTRAIGEQVLVYDGIRHGDPTIEGPKFYKKDGWYYIFAPAGGVKTGWQKVLRSSNIYGPYEERTVLQQGKTTIHGPHQGGWVTDTAGKDWFLHFEDRYAWGRVVHLEPMTWTEDGWCIMGVDNDGDGIGEPVLEYEAPASASTSASTSTAASTAATLPVGSNIVSALETRTGFVSAKVPLNWQWHSKPEVNWMMTDPADACIRLNCIKKGEDWKSLWNTPNLLLEKVVGPTMTLTAKVVFRPSYEGDRTGLVVMGRSYSSIDLCYDGEDVKIIRHDGIGANQGSAETEGKSKNLVRTRKDRSPFYTAYLRVEIKEDCVCTFSYSFDGEKYSVLGNEFKAVEGDWIGAKVGFYAIADIKKNDGGYAEIY